MKKVRRIGITLFLLLAVSISKAQLPDEQYLKIVQNALIHDSRCEQACWLGLQPGLTTFDELDTVIKESFDTEIGITEYPLGNGAKHYYIGFIFTEEADESPLPSTRIGFTLVDDIIDKIDVDINMFQSEAELWGNFTPPEILKLYGTPSHIFISGTHLAYSLWFIYENHKIVAEYVGKIENVDKTTSQGDACFQPSNIYELHLRFYSPQYTSLLSTTAMYRATTTGEEMTGLTNWQFADFVLQNERECLRIHVGIAGIPN